MDDRRSTIDDLNRTDRAGFLQAVGWVYEGSPWVAERAWDLRPFASLDALHDAMMSTVAAATMAEQLDLLRAHPDLGARVAMTEASKREQAGVGLDTLARDDVDRLQALNKAYREKFGFPFLYAVKGGTKQDVLNALERRLTSARDAEHKEALRQVYRIARFRLEEVVRQP